MMWNFEFEDMDNGGYFFVQAATIEEAWSIVDDLACYCHFTGGVYTDEEAEELGYDTY